MSRHTRMLKEKRDRKKSRELDNTVQYVTAVKMVSLLVLRNEGYGEVRLKRFSDKFNEILVDVGVGLLDLNDILEVLVEETGLNLEELSV